MVFELIKNKNTTLKEFLGGKFIAQSDYGKTSERIQINDFMMQLNNLYM